jgi:3-phosphoshikimate 1-carboxyvinyltransferase
VIREDDAIEVVVNGPLSGIEVDMRDASDTAQTLAAIAPYATGPTNIGGIGFIRAKETDRLRAVVTELRRAGIEADEYPDGIVVHPGRPRPTVVRTYDDHRMAMSFSLLGLGSSGIEISDPDCVSKTFPEYWLRFDELRMSAR